MYNPEIKERFLREGTERSCKNFDYIALFNSYQPFEAYEQKDIAQMSSELIADIFSRGKSFDPRTTRAYINLINKYRAWCLTVNVLPDCNHEIITVEMIGKDKTLLKIQKEYFLTAGDMLSKLNQISPVDEGYPEAAMLCLAWIGMSAKEACNLFTNQIDFKNGIIYDANGHVWFKSIDAPILEALQIYEKTYKAQRSTYTVTKSGTRYFLQKMLRTGEACKNAPIPSSTIQSALTIANQKYKRRTGEEGISVNAVSKSGALNRLRKLELEGIDIYVKQNATLVQKCFGVSSISARDCLKLYEQYKEAFGL